MILVFSDSLSFAECNVAVVAVKNSSNNNFARLQSPLDETTYMPTEIEVLDAVFDRVYL